MRKTVFFLVFFTFLMGMPVFAEIGEIDPNSGPPAEAPAPRDRSAMWVKSGSRVTLLVVDPQGRRAGVNPKDWDVLREIPDSQCDVDFIPNKYTGEEHYEATERMTFDPAQKGTYKMWVHGLQGGPFEVSVTALSRNGSSQPTKDVEGLIIENENKMFRLSYDPAPNARLSIVENPN